ncbi:MAG TPA: protein kinase [Lacipirellulaceae bacterium]|nr:protein kinase [Lacipirellulaceae bacterium]
MRQRLELFLQICSAITHAHTKLIIHRDIKSSNVLAYFDDEKQPMVKVNDFGVAKALSGNSLSDATLYTAHGEVLGTYDSMSPEQAAGSSDIDTRTDVYSLGVLLYELLAGAKPFDYARVADHEIRRIIREVEPPPPSTRLSSLGEAGSQIAAARRSQLDTLTKELGGELEWISLMAMRKARDRRYKSPAALAADVERYIAGEPLEAGPESLGYRVRKFTAKHRIPIVVGMVVAVSLALGLLGTATQMVRAKRAENDANKQRDQLKTQNDRAADILKGVVFNDVPKGQIETKAVKHFSGPDDVHNPENEEGWTFIIKRDHDGKDDFRVYRGWGIDIKSDADFQSLNTPVDSSAALGALAYSVDRAMQDLRHEKENAEIEAYIADLSAAQSALASDHYAEARERLEACPESRRGWEWNFLHEQTAGVVRIVPAGYEIMEFTRDGKRMVVNEGGGIVRWWDLEGKPIGEKMKAGEGLIWTQLITDGAQLITASQDGNIGFWDSSGYPLRPLFRTSEEWQCGWYADGF